VDRKYERPTVLLVEDDEAVQRFLQVRVGDEVRLLQARTVMEAIRLFAEYWSRGDLDAIITDGALPSGSEEEELTAVKFVTGIRQFGFRGPIIPISSSRRMQADLIKAGADLRYQCSKNEAADMVRVVLGALSS